MHNSFGETNTKRVAKRKRRRKKKAEDRQLTKFALGIQSLTWTHGAKTGSLVEEAISKGHQISNGYTEVKVLSCLRFPVIAFVE